MHRFGAVVAMLLSLFTLTPVASADTVYDLVSYPADQNGWNLSGTITTDGKVGMLTDADITAWTWTATQGSTSYTFSSTDSDAYVDVQDNLTATPTQILLSVSQSNTLAGTFGLIEGGGPGAAFINWQRGSGGQYYLAQAPGNPLWSTTNPSMGGTDPWVIATASVPEPSTFALAASSALIGLAYGVTQRRRARRDAARAEA